MLPIIGIAVIGLAAAALASEKLKNLGESKDKASEVLNPLPDVVSPAKVIEKIIYTKLSDLPDVNPEDQGGGYNENYDSSFLSACIEVGVPFALLKAHAIRESSLKPAAYHKDYATKASFGLMQIEWWPNSNRFQKYGYSDDMIGDGSYLYDPDVNVYIGASIIRDNMGWLKNLRDAINAYNTGTKESKRQAPFNYVNDVVKYYNEILGSELIS